MFACMYTCMHACMCMIAMVMGWSMYACTCKTCWHSNGPEVVGWDTLSSFLLNGEIFCNKSWVWMKGKVETVCKQFNFPLSCGFGGLSMGKCAKNRWWSFSLRLRIEGLSCQHVFGHFPPPTCRCKGLHFSEPPLFENKYDSSTLQSVHARH